MKYILSLITFIGLFNQEPNIRDKVLLEALDGIRLFELSKVDSLLHELEVMEQDSFEVMVTNIVRWKYLTLAEGTLAPIPIDSTVKIPSELSVPNAIYQFYYGDYLNERGGYDSIGTPYYSQAKLIGEQLQSPLLICEALKRMIESVSADQEKKNPGMLKALSDEYESVAFDSFEKDLSWLMRWKTRSAIEKKPYVEALWQGEARARENGNDMVLARYLKLLGVKHELYDSTLKAENISFDNIDKAWNLYEESINLYEKYLPANFARYHITGLTMNKGVLFHFQNQPDSTEKYLNLAREMLTVSDQHHPNLLDHWFALHYEGIGRVELAFPYMKKELKHLKKISDEQVDISVAEIYTRYDTEKKERRIESLAYSRRIYGVSILLLVVILTLLILRFRAARQAAIQDKKLHNQKINELMSNQELRMIQAAIEAEEKERARMAEDLHDRLGSTLSATRMHMDVLEDQPEGSKESQTERIKKLLDKAIEDTRQISHNMLSGVLAKFGLKAAIEDLKETVTSVNNLDVRVEYGKFQIELPKEVEVQVFRIIQELMSNTLKHAYADGVKISFEQKESVLELVFADDGLGFDLNADHDGIGLKNIKSRLHKINAEYDYQSNDNGTTMTINIPT